MSCRAGMQGEEEDLSLLGLPNAAAPARPPPQKCRGARWRPARVAAIAIAATVAAWAAHEHLVKAAAEGSQSDGPATGAAVLEEYASPGRPIIPQEWLHRWNAGNLVFNEGAKVAPGLMPNIGNGYMGIQFGRKWMYVSGVFNGVKGKSHRARVPVPFRVSPLKPPEGTALDFERGVVEQVFRWPAASGTQRTYIHQARPHVAVTELELNNTRGSRPLTVKLFDGFHQEIQALRFPKDPAATDLKVLSWFRNATTTCLDFITKHPESGWVNLTVVALCRANVQRKYTVPAGKAKRILMHSTVWTSLDLAGPHPWASTPMQAARRELDALPHTSPEALYAEHLAAMGRLWETGIEVEGNTKLAKNVNSSWWNLLLSYRADQHMSSSPGGLANDCYKGHTFWDVESFMWPNLLMFHPELAEASLQYRFDRRKAASNLAAAHGLKGLQFPWESAGTGEEACPWHEGHSEIHISGDVSFAFWQYWQATGDRSWLRSIGWPVLRGIADFWASRAATLPGRGFAIKDVVDVDEKARHVTDSAYTNAVAKLALSNAEKAANQIGKQAEINPRWSDVARRLPIPFDQEHQHHLQSAGAVGGNGLGVVMMQYPLAVPSYWANWSPKVRRNDLFFFRNNKLTMARDKGNAMYWWAFAIAYLEIGQPAAAAKYFRRTTVHNVFGNFHTWSEMPGGKGCPNFVTGAGGFLQTIWAGYGGVRLQDGALTISNPHLPPQTSGLRFRGLTYRGNRVDVRITARMIILRLREKLSEDAPSLAVSHTKSQRHEELSVGEDKIFPIRGVVRLEVAELQHGRS